MKDKAIGVCYVCGLPLEWDEANENCNLDDYLDEEGSVLKEIKCTNCGTLYRNYITEDNKIDSDADYVSCNYQGFGNCIHCGGTNIWGNDFMRSDLDDSIKNDEDDSLVRSLTCAHCGCAIEVLEPSQTEIKNNKFPFWVDKENKGE